MSRRTFHTHKTEKEIWRVLKYQGYLITAALTLGSEIGETARCKQDSHAFLQLFAIERLAFMDWKHIAQRLLVGIVEPGKADFLDNGSETWGWL
jgi:hypothetical protein